MKGLRVQTTDFKVQEYCISKSNIPSNDCLELENYTKANIHGSNMLIGQMEASIIGFLLRSINAKRILELGTYTGYSALTMAENIPSDGEVITIDINQDTVAVAQEYWSKAAHGKKIKSVIGKALDVLPTLNGKFDFVFIDNDKRNYIEYLKICMPMLSENGMVVIDNVLWGGKVLPDAELDLTSHRDRNVEFIRQVNDFIRNSEELYGTLLPIRDGMFLVQKKRF